MSVPLTHAEQLIEKAQQGEMLSPQERRHCVHWFMVNEPDKPNTQIARLFSVSERLIRRDKDKIRAERAEVIKQDDIALVIADLVMTYERQMRDLEYSKRTCKRGSQVFLNHCLAIAKVQGELIERLQRLGFYPTSLGTSVIEKFEYKAVVNERTGSTMTLPIEIAQCAEAEFEDLKDGLIDAEPNLRLLEQGATTQ